jgi:ABC-type transporter MlaC component
MKTILIALSLAVALSSCQTDAQVAKVNGYVQKYCAQLQAASDIATSMSKKTLVTKIDKGVAAYCSGPIDNVPTALLALAQIYKAVTDAGIPVASN